MGLIKPHETEIGVTASYWKLGSFTIDTVRKEASFIFHLYIDKGASKPIESLCIDDFITKSWSDIDSDVYANARFDYYFNNKGKNFKDWQTACYVYAKEFVPFFADAVDDPDEATTIPMT